MPTKTELAFMRRLLKQTEPKKGRARSTHFYRPKTRDTFRLYLSDIQRAMLDEMVERYQMTCSALLARAMPTKISRTPYVHRTFIESQAVNLSKLTAAMDNVTASQLGEVCLKAADPKQKVGDLIDRGLILNRLLNEAGFSLIRS